MKRSLFTIGCMSILLVVSAAEVSSFDTDVYQQYREWAPEPDEQEPPSRSDVLGAKACMCVMTGTCLGVFLWVIITRIHA